MEEPEKKEEEIIQTDPYWDRLGNEITENWKKDLENLMKSDTLELSDITYKFLPVKGKDVINFKKLDAESFKIKDKDSQEFYDNVKERACVIIEGMTPEKFDDGDYKILEDLTTAWSNRALRGFRRSQQSVPNVL